MEGLGLAEFLADLRVELGEAHKRASGGALKLGVDHIELSLEVAYTLEKSGESDARVKAKFWVLEFGEAGAKGSITSERARTQHLKLVLNPRIENTVMEASGGARTESRTLDVVGHVEQAEENPVLPPPPTRASAES